MKDASVVDLVQRLSLRARVAFGWAITERLMDIYRAGNLKYLVRDIDGLPSDLSPDQDAIELGHELAWRFVAEGIREPGIAMPIIEAMRARPIETESKTVSLAGNGAIFGVIDTLYAMDREPRQGANAILSRATHAISLMVRDVERKPTIAAQHEELERSWQVRVAQHLEAHGAQPITRALLAEPLEERAPWRDYFDAYAGKWSPAPRKKSPSAPRKKSLSAPPKKSASVPPKKSASAPPKKSAAPKKAAKAKANLSG